MAGTGPRIPLSPLELLTNDGTRKPSVLHNVWGYLLGGGLGLGASIYSLYLGRRPIYSGIHRTIAITALCAFVGHYLDQEKEKFFAEKDAMIRHYVELHPEDFPPRVEKKYAEVLEPWVPVR